MMPSTQKHFTPLTSAVSRHSPIATAVHLINIMYNYAMTSDNDEDDSQATIPTDNPPMNSSGDDLPPPQQSDSNIEPDTNDEQWSQWRLAPDTTNNDAGGATSNGHSPTNTHGANYTPPPPTLADRKSVV